MRRNGFPWMAWWYAAISAGFVLLAIVYTVLHDKPWMIAVRAIIAAGFAFLAVLEFRAKRRGR
ncbi:MAG TPA: hypothetical protein VFB14_08470 [Bryobacteraceae bacterium]|nr:hypothetical protein [Bryobacteraceae bacterium]